MEKKLIIFDVDGTLWDSERDVFLAFNYTLKNIIGIEINQQEFKKLAGLTIELMFERILPDDKKDLAPECTKFYRNYYIDEGHYIDSTVLFNNVKETIEELGNKGILMAILSSKPKRIVDKMVEHFGLNGFKLVIGTALSNFKSKPEPEAINYIMEELDISKEDAVMVGDAKTDVLAGQNAGIDTIAVTYGYDKIENLISLNPTYMIDDFGKLLEIIKI